MYENFFDASMFKFIKFGIDLTNELEQIYNSAEKLGKFNVKPGTELSYEKLDNFIQLSLSNNTFNIENNPITFVDNDDNVLFKLYERNNKIKMQDLIEAIDSYFLCYDTSNNKICTSDLKTTNLSRIKLIRKESTLLEIFKPLFKINKSNTKENEIIDSSELIPFDSNDLGIKYKTKFNMIINQRNEFIDELNAFGNSNKKILKIYGSDGIGKSVTLLYFTTLKNEFKIVYFNLKDIFKFEFNVNGYFKKAIMKYFCHYDFAYEGNININSNYLIYQQICEKLENIGDFWKLLENFVNIIIPYKKSIIILDQYKKKYNKDDAMKTIISNVNSNNHDVKFIIASSINDYSVKRDFINDLWNIFEDGSDLLKQENVIQKVMVDTEFNLFEKMDFKSIKNIKNKNKDFKKISMFKEKSAEVENNNIVENKNKFKIPMTDKSLKDITKIIYVNKLISVQEIIEKNNSELLDLLDLFDFNPKSLHYYNSFFNQKESLDKEKIPQIFKENIYQKIDKKVSEFYFYKSKENVVNSGNEITGTSIAQLINIIKSKEQFDFVQLIKYIEKFPFKYLKIKIKDFDNKIITLDKNLVGSEFMLDYSYKFIDIALKKILYMLPSSTMIMMEELSDSALGSFLENKILKYMETKNINIRHCWDLYTIDIKNEKLINEYDFNTFNKIEFDEKLNFKIKELNKIYYIIPANQSNRLLDSALLIPAGNNSFNLICFQITKHKKIKNNKKEYENYCFMAKTKFEKIYDIKIQNVFFYFILAADQKNEDTKKELENMEIAYFYYNIKKVEFRDKNDYLIDITSIDNLNGEIFNENYGNEYKSVESKKRLIIEMEQFLKKKRRKEKNFEITEDCYEAARKFLFTQTSHISLDIENEKKMKKLISNLNKKYLNTSFTLQYVFNIKLSESSTLYNEDDLIGLIIDINDNNKRQYCYVYKGEFIKSDEKSIISESTYFQMLKKENRVQKIIPFEEDYEVENIPEKKTKQIFVFKIYILDK